MRPDLTAPGRRNVLALAGAAAMLRTAHAAPASPPFGKLDFSSPASRLRAFLLMRGALDGRLVVGFISGRYYGAVDSEITPLFGVVGATFERYKATPDGGYECISYEIPFFTDLDSGEMLQHFRNPYTGETVAVPQKAYPPARIRIGRDLMVTLPAPPPGMTFRHRVLPPEQHGNDVWMVEETITAMQLALQAGKLRYSEIVTLHARASDLQSPGARQVPCQTGYNSVVSWRPWLKMGNRPGNLIGNGFGRYGAKLDELPANWLKAARLLHADILADPGAKLSGL